MKKNIIHIPLYNDWGSLWKLSKEINNKAKDINAKFSFLFVNDTSADKKSSFELVLSKIH